MKKLSLFISFLLLLAVSSHATTNVAFIYNTDLVDVNSFKTLLEANNCSVTLVPVASTITTNYSTYDVVITSPASTLTKAQMDTLNSKNKPIVSMGSGGYKSLGQLSLSIGSPFGMSGTENTMYVEDASLGVYNSPNKITINSGDSLRLFSVAASSSPARMIYVPTPVATIEGLLRYRPLYYAVVRQNGKYTFWGFALSPASMTQAGKDLFVNTIADAVTKYALTTSISGVLKNLTDISIVHNSGSIAISGLTENGSISLYDIHGKSLLSSSNSRQIDVSGFKKGIYLLKIATPKGVVTRKIIL